MKKLVFVACLMVAACFASCGNKTESGALVNDSDTVVVDTLDSVMTDSLDSIQ